MRVPQALLNLGGFTVERVTSWVPTLAVWGGVAGVGALWFLDSVPPVKRDILSRVPFLGARYLPPDESK